MKLLLQARIRGCDGQSRRSALRHTARVGLRASRLRVPVSLHVCTLSRRTFMNTAGKHSLMGGNYKASCLRNTTSQGHGDVPSSRMLKKSANLSCSFGLFGPSGLSRLIGLFGLSCLFG